jgi:hypothetical protein
MNKYYKYCFGWAEIKFFRFYFIVSIIFTPLFYIILIQRKIILKQFIKHGKKNQFIK